MNGSSCLFPYFTLSRSCQFLLAKCHLPCLGLLNLQAFLYLYLIRSFNDGVFGSHNKDSAKALAFAKCQIRASHPETKVPAAHGTPSIRSRPEDARSSSLVGKGTPPPKRPKIGGRCEPGSGALLSSRNCLVAWRAFGRFENCPGVQRAP